MKKKYLAILAIVLVIALGVGGFLYYRYRQKEQARIAEETFRANLAAATLKVCDHLNQRKEKITFKDEEYAALSRAAGIEIASTQDAMRTQVIRVTIVEKFRALMEQSAYDEVLDLMCYLSQNHFYFYMEGNDFDIVFADEERDLLTSFIVSNSEGTVTTGDTTSHLYKGRTMIFGYGNQFVGIRDEAADIHILVATEDQWRDSLYRSCYCFRVGDQFAEENLLYEPLIERPESDSYSFSDYLKDADPDLYNSIVDRYNNLKP